jgi:16S rRNA (uracil1498-N3)-methyltransferase
VAPVSGFAQWLEAAPASAKSLWVLSLAAGARTPAAMAASASASLCVLSGPEGGLAPVEEQAARDAGFVPVTLGPRVLRADTAPLALLAFMGLRA